MSHGASGLALLEQERENILLAEVAGLLHDIGKFCDLHIEAESVGGTRKWNNDHAYKAVVDRPDNLIRLSKAASQLRKPDVLNNVQKAASPKASDFLPTPVKEVLEKKAVSIRGESYTLAEIIMLGTPGFATNEYRAQLLDSRSGWLPAVLGVCHHEAHHDKPDIKELGKQNFPYVLVSRAFGYEMQKFFVRDPQRGLDARLKSLPISLQSLSDLRSVVEKIRAEFEYGLGDTRRPVNEVTLANWASSVATLFKSALSASILDSKEQRIHGWLSWRNKEMDHDLNWCLLHIAFDGLAFLERAPTVGDLLGRREALHAALNQVRELLEVKYPLGNEIYRDENGSAFVVPALDGDDSEGNRLRGLIETLILDKLQQGDLGGELCPKIRISPPSRQATELNKELEKPKPPIRPFLGNLRHWWQGEVADVCTACGVRPQGWGARDYTTHYAQVRTQGTCKRQGCQTCKALYRNICYVCLERRGERAKVWAQARYKIGEACKPWERTIWLDEVADDNDRLALVVGRFDLTQWLNGEMVQTLLVVCDPSNNRYVPKNPSFARLQRIWRTTQKFWQDVQDEDIPSTVVHLQQKRLIIGISNEDELHRELGDHHVYDAEMDGQRLSVIWNSEYRRLLTADNLQVWAGTKEGAEALLNRLPETLPLFEPGGYRQQRSAKVIAQVDPNKSEVFPLAYSPAIALLTEPSMFMALVPAIAALDVAVKVHQRYEREMSKVRNRLPLFLGLVFFHRRQPLFSALDAGRRMLNQQLHPIECTVIPGQHCDRAYAQSDQELSHLDHPHFEQWQKLKLLTNEDELLSWRVSTKMGDGNTDDEWYPYYHVLSDKNGNPPTNRKRHFKKVMVVKQRPDGGAETSIEIRAGNEPDRVDDRSIEHWIHVEDIAEGDKIQVTPARFSWLFLDTSARRFEVGNCKLLLLDELAHIRDLWKRLKDLAESNKLTESRWHAVVTLLQNKAEAWGKDSTTYQNFAETVRIKEGLDTLSREDMISGRLQATFELYTQILKQKLKEEQP